MANPGPKISVILSFYNNADCIRESILSIVRQTYGNWELILIDDGSTDNSLFIASDTVRRSNIVGRTIILSNKVNKGLAASLNQALDHVTGKLVARMDADDVSLEHRFQIQVRVMRKSSVELCGSFGISKEDGSIIEKPTDIPLALENLKNPFIHSSMMIKKEFFDIFRYDESLLRAQDLDLWLRSSGRVVGVNISEPLIVYKIKSRQSIYSLYSGLFVRLRYIFTLKFRKIPILTGRALLYFAYGFFK